MLIYSLIGLSMACKNANDHFNFADSFLDSITPEDDNSVSKLTQKVNSKTLYTLIQYDKKSALVY